MTYLDDYKARLAASGANAKDARIKSTEKLVIDSFKDSPGYVQATVNGVVMDAVMQLKQNSGIKSLVFLPGVIVSRGSIATIGADKWLLADFDSNPLYPRAEIKKCNQIARWTDGPSTLESPCMMGSQNMYDNSSDKVVLAKGEFFVHLPYDATTSKLLEDMRLIMGKRAYKVISHDNITFVEGEKGVLVLQVTTDLLRAGDSLTDNVADNTKPTSGGSLW